MHVLVIGGGVAGNATAIALRKLGIDVSIAEARSADDIEGGAWLGVASNGLNALHTLELRETVLKRSLADPHVGPGGRSGFAPIERAVLYRVLTDAATAWGAQTLYDKKFAFARTATDGSISAEFSDGSTLCTDLLVGCDGIHSRTRSIIDPSAPAPRYVPLLNIGGFSDGVTVPGPAVRLQFVRSRRGFFGYVTSADRGQVWWFANLPCPVEPSRAELAAETRESLSTKLLHAFVDGPPFVSDIIGATSSEMYATSTHDLPRVPAWWRENMIVLGDAAHAPTPTSGQGASMALEDAVVFAKCIRDCGTPSAAAARYEQVRRPRVEAIVALGARASATKIDHTTVDDSLEWVHDYRLDWGSPA